VIQPGTLTEIQPLPPQPPLLASSAAQPLRLKSKPKTIPEFIFSLLGKPKFVLSLLGRPKFWPRISGTTHGVVTEN
jgi:hypothetical protein